MTTFYCPKCGANTSGTRVISANCYHGTMIKAPITGVYWIHKEAGTASTGFIKKQERTK